MIFVVRHGERSDDVNVDKLDFKEWEFDPNLTLIGKKQANITGIEINNICENEKKFVIVSSPFLRCIETAINISKSLPKIYENTIFLQDSLGEWLYHKFFETNIIEKDLIFKKYQNKEFLESDFKFEMEFAKNKDLIAPNV